MSEDILREIIGVLEEHFPQAEVFRPRYVDLEAFTSINDEYSDEVA